MKSPSSFLVLVDAAWVVVDAAWVDAAVCFAVACSLDILGADS